MTMLDKYIDHCRNHSYMSGVERAKLRVKQNGEIFTPTELTIDSVDKLEERDYTLFKDPKKVFLENSCGDGQFLSEVVIRKMERSGCTLEQALSTTYGVELMEDNVKLCKERLAGPNPTQEILDILDKNIVCANALTYHYRFDGTDPETTEQELKLQKFI